jgi:hypothetical protein
VVGGEKDLEILEGLAQQYSDNPKIDTFITISDFLDKIVKHRARIALIDELARGDAA